MESKKRKNVMKRKLRYFIIICIVIVLAAGLFILKKAVDYKNNFFAYAIDLKNKNWTYAPKGLDYGMTVEEVIKAEEIVNYTWEKQNEILCTEQNVTKNFGKNETLKFVKRYFFDSKGGLASVRYELVTDYSYYEELRQQLYEQAQAYMPETNRKTEIEDIIDIGERNERFVAEKLEDARESDNEDYRKIKIPVTRVVWEDTVYTSEESDTIQKYADSDAVLGIDIRYDGEVTVSLAVSRFENRLSVAEVQQIRDQYPMHCIDDELEAVSDMLISISQLYPVDWDILNTETVVYVEVTDDYATEFTKRYGERYMYPVRVLTDTEGKYTEGEDRVFVKYAVWENYGPEAYGGSVKLIFPDSGYHSNDIDLTYSSRSLFYVTEEGYVISGIDESDYSGAFERCTVSESSLCGLTAEDLLRKLKK